MAADLVGRKVDVIAAITIPPALAAKNATSTIPIVFRSVCDPLALGLVASLAHPGGNLTGFSNNSTELLPKRLELLCELVPNPGMIAFLVNPDNPYTKTRIEAMQEAARAKGIELTVLKAATDSDIDDAFASLVQQHAGGLVMGADPFLLARREQIAALALRDAVPVIEQAREFTDAGGLISYGPSITAEAREFGIYVGRILKGEKPADLPVQQPTKFELVINVKTAKALGLTVPQSLIAQAAEVIE